MAYSDFTLETVETELGVTARPGVLFPELLPLPVPSWLRDALDRGMRLSLMSEKARSEFIVGPILLAVREQSHEQVAILSGERLDVDPGRRLIGECDFILALSDPIPRLRAPVLIILEAKKHDLDAGLGQCVAQMVGAQVFNDRSGQPVPAVYGCVTTGESWQFLRLVGPALTIGRGRLYVDNVGGILAALHTAVQHAGSGHAQFQPAGPTPAL